MRIIEIMTPCRCAEHKGAQTLSQVILNAESPEDIKILEEFTLKIRSDAEAKGAQVAQYEISFTEEPVSKEKRRKTQAAPNN